MIWNGFLFILLLFSIPIAFAQSDELIFCNKVSKESPIFVITDKENYEKGDTIIVSGCLAPNAQTKGVNLKIYDPDGQRITGFTFVPNGGYFSQEFVIDENFAINGTYAVEVDSAGLYQATKTFVVPEFGSLVFLVLITGLMISIIGLRIKFNYVT